MTYKMRGFGGFKSSPAKQKVNKGGEAQDQNKIFDEKGNHVGTYVNGKKVMKSTVSVDGQLSDAQYEFEQDLKNAKTRSKTKTTEKKKPSPTKKIEGSKAMRDKVADVTKANLNVVNKLRRDQGKSDLTDPNKKTNSKKKPAPTKLAPLVAMAGKAILGKVAGKVAGKLINGNKKEE